MWGAESARGDVDLLRLPLSRFGDGTEPLEEDDYRRLPGLGANWGRVQNRFVGDHLIYSATLSHDDDEPENESVPEREGLLTTVPLNGGPVQRFMVTGEIGRIEVMGSDALVVSSDEAVVFTTVALDGSRPIIADQFVMPGAEEAETRSHAFFYQPDASSPDAATGVLGLPVVRDDPAEEAGQYSRHDRRGLASIAYLRRGEGRLRSVGSLDSALEPGFIDDGCVASCVDWYGDARPIFLSGRIFALLGYELVEGRERGGRIREVRRVSFSPPAPEGPRP